MAYHYVYILQSVEAPSRYYTGITEDLKKRMRKHNAGEVPHTAKFRPWKLRTAISFDDYRRGLAFEKYLKSHSGRVFSSRHF